MTPGLGRSPGGGHGNPLRYSCLENPHGQRSLTGYSSWGLKESDTTEHLSTAQRSRLDSRLCALGWGGLEQQLDSPSPEKHEQTEASSVQEEK